MGLKSLLCKLTMFWRTAAQHVLTTLYCALKNVLRWEISCWQTGCGGAPGLAHHTWAWIVWWRDSSTTHPYVNGTWREVWRREDSRSSFYTFQHGFNVLSLFPFNFKKSHFFGILQGSALCYLGPGENHRLYIQTEHVCTPITGHS